ncbi:MAG: phosphoribosylamine--glycine ligase [Bacteroidia bacterium]
MNVLLLGSGGREHALAWKMAQSPKLSQLYIAPGNAGTLQHGKNVSLPITDAEAVTAWARENNIDLIVIGPEAPLVAGVADRLRDAGFATIGPGIKGARLEGSKDFSKRFMQRHGIPTAAYATFNQNQLTEALDYVNKQELPVVVKADGLAAGKGVLICLSHGEAEEAVKDMLEGGAFGEAGSTVVIEQYLDGIEISVFVLTDGEHYKLLPSAKDYKRIGEGDNGLNTGGMGAVSPVPFATSDFMADVEERIVKPTLEGLKKDDIPYQGFIFIGLMVIDGKPFVLEYNARMGDPETEVVMPRIQTDLLEAFAAVADQHLDQVDFSIDPHTCTTVMLVSGGYPGNYEKGKGIYHINDVTDDAIIFHAGTRMDGDVLVTDGGRVIAVSALGESIEHAIHISMSNAARIEFDGKYFRTDIGKDLM